MTVDRSSTRWGAALLSACAFAAAAPAEAAVSIAFQAVGSDVVATLAGSVNLTGMTSQAYGEVGSVIWPGPALVYFGGPVDYYYGSASGPGSWGGFAVTQATSKAGDAFALDGKLGVVSLPSGYTSRAPLAATMTFSGLTFGDLGLDVGRYVYTLPHDKIVVTVGNVPEPASWAMLIAGFGLVGAAMRRRAAAAAIPAG